MKKFTAVLLALVICISISVALRPAWDGKPFKISTYFERMQNLPEKPTVQSLQYITNEDVWDEAKFYQKTVMFFNIIIDCVKYPFQMIGYYGECVLIFAGFVEPGAPSSGGDDHSGQTGTGDTGGGSGIGGGGGSSW